MGLEQGQQRLRRILLVDDHADTRDLLVRLLGRRFDVVAAACYESALASAQASADAGTPPDIVVTDVGLPGGDGITLMRTLRDRYNIPGVAVTGHAIDNAATYREAGFAKWLQKPIRFEQLMTALDETSAAIAK